MESNASISHLDAWWHMILRYKTNHEKGPTYQLKCPFNQCLRLDFSLTHSFFYTFGYVFCLRLIWLMRVVRWFVNCFCFEYQDCHFWWSSFRLQWIFTNINEWDLFDLLPFLVVICLDKLVEYFFYAWDI